MKIPGIGEVKPIWMVAAVGSFGVGYIVWRRQKQAQATADAAAAQSTDDSIDPSTGMPYADEESGDAGIMGSIDPETGYPYAYENSGSGTGNTLSTSPITSNEEWITEAEQDAQYDFGATEALSQSAIADYIAQSPAGLPSNEYQLVSQIIATIGPPPVGSFRLIQAQGTTVTTPPPPPPPPPTGTSPPPPPTGTPDKTLVPYIVKPHDTLSGIAASHGETLAEVESDNPVYLTNPKYDHGDLIFSGDKVMLEE